MEKNILSNGNEANDMNLNIAVVGAGLVSKIQQKFLVLLPHFGLTGQNCIISI